MLERLRSLDRLQRIALVLFIAMIVNSILISTTGYQIIGGDLLSVLFGFALIGVLIRALLTTWRKRRKDSNAN